MRQRLSKMAPKSRSTLVEIKCQSERLDNSPPPPFLRRWRQRRRLLPALLLLLHHSVHHELRDIGVALGALTEAADLARAHRRVNFLHAHVPARIRQLVDDSLYRRLLLLLLDELLHLRVCVATVSRHGATLSSVSRFLCGRDSKTHHFSTLVYAKVAPSFPISHLDFLIFPSIPRSHATYETRHDKKDDVTHMNNHTRGRVRQQGMNVQRGEAGLLEWARMGV